MTKAEMRKLFTELRDMCKSPKFEKAGRFWGSKGDEYERVARALLDSNTLDVDYASHIKGTDGYTMASHPENLTFEECCTAMTYLVRAQHWDDITFMEALQDGTVYKLLTRMCEVL